MREYLIIDVRNGTPIWREAVDGRYRKLPTRLGALRSRAFPGLWLNVQALAKLDWPSMRATLDQGLASADHAAFVRHLTQSRRDT